MTRWQLYSEIITLLWPALATAAAIALSASQVGVFVLLRRQAIAALALPQAAAVGVAASLRWQWLALPSAILSGAAALILLTIAQRRAGTEALLAVLYVAGLSISFLLLANAGAHVGELQHLVTGMDVAVGPATALTTSIAVTSAGVVCSLLWRRWLLIAQMPDAAQLSGLSPARWDLLFLCLLGVVVVVGTAAQGVVMVLAMLFLPAATVLPWCRRIPAALAWSAAIALLYLIAGFIASVEMDWPLSQSAAAAGFCGTIISYVAHRGET